jgi:hypothetical protein
VVVSVSVFQPLPGDGIGFLVSATVARGKIRTEGPRADLIDTSRPMFSSRRSSFIEFGEDREEWLRSFAESFRSAQVVAAIIKDTQHKELVAPPEIIERIESAQQLAAH